MYNSKVCWAFSPLHFLDVLGFIPAKTLSRHIMKNSLYDRKHVMHATGNNDKDGVWQVHIRGVQQGPTASIQSFKHTYGNIP